MEQGAGINVLLMGEKTMSAWQSSYTRGETTTEMEKGTKNVVCRN
jgi:hypothetical protein